MQQAFTMDDKCFGCDQENCDYTDFLGFAWHWGCFQFQRSDLDEEFGV